MSDAATNKALVGRAVAEVFNGGDLAAAGSLFAPDYAEHEKRFAQLIRGAFPDLELHIEQQVAEGDLVATRWRATGTHQGAFLGIEPTGVHAQWSGFWLQRVAGARIIEGQDWGSWDRAGLVEQLRGAANDPR